MTPPRQKLLVVDDSPAMQQLFSLLLGGHADIEISAVCDSAETGWGAFAQAPPDIVLLDLELPGRPGIDLLRRIMQQRPTPVIIVSANGGEGSAATLEALGAGAVAFIEKPNTVDTSVEAFRDTLLATIRAAARSAQPLTRVARLPEPASPVQPPGPLMRDRVICIGASTGGVAAIQSVLLGLNRLPLPILVTQHMPSGYTRRFAERLQQVTGYLVKEAADGDELIPSRVLIAPGDRHLILANAGGVPVARLQDGPPVSGHKPSVDVMFGSAAERLGSRAIGVLLTGMGRDGAEGLLAMRRAGAQTAVENEATAVVFGMPKAALELKATETDLPLPAIPRWIATVASERQKAAPAGGGDKPKSLAKDLRTKPIPAFRVLVVDDQKSMRGLATHALRELGFQLIDEAESGEAALQAVGKGIYDLMLADWNMDGMSGVDLVKAVRRERDAREIVVVMTTSENHISKVSEAMAAGANNYLIKPCEAQKLRQRLERALARSLAA